MRIDIWSDVVCPWCWIGKRRFEAALARFPHADEVEVVWRAFELDPTAPEEGHETVVAALGRKYGGGEAAGRQLMAHTAQAAAEVGLRFDYAHALHTRTLDAHRLLHLALARGGPALQDRVAEALFSAYFSHGRSMADHAVLRAAGTAAGLDTVQVDAVLSGTGYAEEVQADLAQARAYGITGVPFFVVDDRYAVSGAQPPEVFTQLLEQAWAASRPLLEVMADGSVCGPDGCAI
jgi:predicted DsbA family dithiol-disulfide isomerase